MNKLKQLIEELRNVNTNDPVMQRRIVKVLDEIVVILDEKQDHVPFDEDGGENCDCTGVVCE